MVSEGSLLSLLTLDAFNERPETRSEAGDLPPPHREATFPPPCSLPAAGSSHPSPSKWKEHPPLPSPFPQRKIPAGSMRACPWELRFAPGERRLCRRLVQFALRPRGWVLGKLILQFWDGLLGGTSQPGCQSVCASPPLLLILLILLLPGHPRVRHGSTRSCAPLGHSGGKSAVPLSGVMMAFFFCPEATGAWFAALQRSTFAKGSRRTRRTAICTSFSQNPSYHFNL